MDPMTFPFDEIANRLLAGPELTPDERETRNRELAEKHQLERNHKMWETWRALTGPMGKRYQDCTLQAYIIDAEAPADAPQHIVSTGITAAST